METKQIVKALRCSSTAPAPEHTCEGCPYVKYEILNERDAQIWGRSEIEYCDVDQMARDAADRLEELAKGGDGNA